MTPDPARSLTDRIRHAAAAQNTDPARLRRRLVFQRILARLSVDGDWILKGGFSLETRLGLRARATRDLDLAFAGAPPTSTLDLQDALADALARPDLDSFRFAVMLPRPIAADEAGNPGWRVNVKANLGGVLFDDIRLDIVVRADEIGSAVERLTIPPPLTGTPFADVRMRTVDLPQHAAEKVHAYARIYSRDRPSSRVKDLIDLALLLECDAVEPARWGSRIVHVFSARDGAAPPTALPEPPESWRDPYAAMAHDVGLSDHDVSAGWHGVDAAYRRAISSHPDFHSKPNGPA